MAIGSRYYRPPIAEFEAHGWKARALPRRGFEVDEPRAGRDRDWSYGDEIGDIAAEVAKARAHRVAPRKPTTCKPCIHLIN